jgi:hypothetical protein
MTDQLAKALTACLQSPNESDRNGEDANVVDGLFAIARSLDKVASALRMLGTNDAATSMGAIEVLAVRLGDPLDRIAAKLPDGG